MEHAIFISCFLISPLIAYLFLHSAGLSLVKISVPSLFFANYIGTAYLGLLPLYFEWDVRAIIDGVTEPDLIMQLLFYSSLSLIVVAAFCYVCSRLHEFRLFHESDAPRAIGNSTNIFIFFLLGLCCFVLIMYLTALPGIPLFSALRGDFEEAVLMRTSTTESIKSSYYRVFYMTILSFLVYLLFANALLARRKKTWVLFSICFSVTLFASIIDSGKGQMIFLIFGLFLTYLLVYDNPLRLKHLVLCLSIIIMLSSLMMIKFMGTSSDIIGDLILSVFERIFSGNMIPAYHVLDMFQNHEYLWGLSFPNPRGLLPYTQFMLDNEIWARIYPQPFGSALQYAAPSVYWAEMYANFGPVGPLVSSIIVGILLYGFQSILSRFPAGPVKYALITWCSIHFMSLAQKSLMSYLVLDYDLYVILLIAIILFKIDKKNNVTILNKKLSYINN